MPKDLPGFYFDAEKNRYFPYKGPIPGSSLKPPSKPVLSDTKQADSRCHRIKIGQEKLLQARELCGNVISSRKGKFSFQAECQNRHASKPMIWRYKRTKKMANIALEHVVADVASPHGLMERDIFLSGSLNALFCFQVGRTRQEIDQTQIYKVDCVWPPNLDQVPRHKELLRQLGYGALTYTKSDVTCIKASRRCFLPTVDTMSKLFVITTLGSESAPGSVYLLDLSKPLNFNASVPMAGDRFFELAAFNHTLWTVDCDPEGRRAAIGTNRGVALLNMETGTSSWVLRCKSDVFSLQHQSRNNILCGRRNGAIVAVDPRHKQITRSGNDSSTVVMPSSVCCLESLKHSDQYFLASSMDGSIRLYDNRVMKRGPVQSYEGNVNTHTRIQLGVDPSEKVVMSGGEDFYLRLWNISSGEMLFKERFMDSIPSAVCWPRTGVHLEEREDYRCYWQDHGLGAWVGSSEGIFYMDWL